MAFKTVFIDGFDHVSGNPGVWLKYSGVGSTDPARVTTNSTIYRTGARSLQLGTGGSSWVSRHLGVLGRTVVVGFALYPTGWGDTSSNHSIRNNGIVMFGRDGNQRYKVHLLDNGTLRFFSAADNYLSGFIWGTTTTVVPLNQWTYIEVRVHSHATAGEFEVRINGVTEISGTGLAFGSLHGIRLDEVSLVTPNTSGAWYFDDFYIRAVEGDDNVAGGFFGDCKVLTRNAIGPGSSTQLTSSSGNPNWQNVNTALPDLATYNHSLTPGDKDLYDFAALADPGAIRSVQVNLLANKTDAGLRLIKPRIKSGATEEAGDAQALSTDERYYMRSWDTDPNTGAAWEHAALDNAEFGLSVE